MTRRDIQLLPFHHLRISYKEDIYYSLKEPNNIEKHLQALYGDNMADYEVNTTLLSSMGIGLHDNRMNMIYSLAAILLVVIVAFLSSVYY